MVLPYRCDQCDHRFFRFRWLSPRPYLERYRASRRRRRLAIAAAAAIVAVSLAVALHWPELLLKTRAGTAYREAIPIQPADGPPPSVSEIPVRPPASASQPSARSAPRLRGRGGIAIVANDEQTAARLRASSATLPEAIRDGSVFSAPSGTSVAILRRRDRLVQIRILDGAMSGKIGWVSDGEITTGARSKRPGGSTSER